MSSGKEMWEMGWKEKNRGHLGRKRETERLRVRSSGVNEEM